MSQILTQTIEIVLKFLYPDINFVLGIKYQQFINFITVYGDMQIKIEPWTDKDIKEFDLSKDINNSLELISFRKDMVIYYVLEKYGGLFMDFDFICLKPSEN
jgi:hypothetical protein